MRTDALKVIVIQLALVLSATSLFAQTNLLLLSYTNVWRFNESGSNLLTAWRSAGYDDAVAPWKAGPGLIGFETGNPQNYPPIQTLLTAPNMGGPITVYFRTQFEFPTGLNRTGVVMVASNYIDDGAVFYLNGAEIYRYRVPGNQTFTTLANGPPAFEGTNEVVTFMPTNLSYGLNLLAVELHQNSISNVDAVFGMSLTASIPAPLVITNQPDNVIVQAGKTATFSVGVSGSNPYYRWFASNSVAGFQIVAGAAGTNFASYMSGVLTTNMSGTAYRVVVTNSLGSVTSAVAVVTVVPDLFGPRLLSAVITNNNLVHIAFDEALLPSSATNHSNYAIAIAGTGDVLTINQNVIIAFANNVTRLTLVESNLSPTNCYVLTVNNIADVRSNTIAPNTQIGLTFPINTNLFGMGQNWKWNEDGVDLGSEWRQPDYVEPIPWSEGNGIFYFDFDPLNPCVGAPSTSISYGYNTYYFRAHFVIPNGLSSRATLRFRYFLDDGAVFYLNGNELFRANMPAGSIDFNTSAAAGIFNAACSNAAVVVTNLLTGTNMVAVEVHQFSSNPDSDVVFGAELDATLSFQCPMLAMPPPQLQMVRQGNNLIFSWTANGFALECAHVITGPWLEAQPNLTNPYTNSTTAAARFYRLRK